MVHAITQTPLYFVWTQHGEKSIKWNATVNKERQCLEETSKLSVPVEELHWENTVYLYVSLIFVPLTVNSESEEDQETSELDCAFNVMYIISYLHTVSVSLIAPYLHKRGFLKYITAKWYSNRE